MRQKSDAEIEATNQQNTLTCVYCGHAYPPGTPTHGSKVLTDHIAKCPKHPMRAIAEENARLVAEMERLQREEHSIKEALGLLAGGVGLPVSEHVRQVVDEKNRIEEKLAEVAAGCDLQRGDRVYRQVPVVIGPGKTQAELDLDAEKKENARLKKLARTLADTSCGPGCSHEGEGNEPVSARVAKSDAYFKAVEEVDRLVPKPKA